jgi:GxxExxY protein
MEFLYKEETFAIRGAVFAVYMELGNGFLEEVYQECLEREMASRGIPFESQKELHLFYRGTELRKTYRPDFVCYQKVIVELKAVHEVVPEHLAQLQNYLKATKLRVGLLVNFCHYPNVDIRRIAY